MILVGRFEKMDGVEAFYLGISGRSEGRVGVQVVIMLLVPAIVPSLGPFGHLCESVMDLFLEETVLEPGFQGLERKR